MSNKKVYAISAMGLNHVIGKDNKLPWHIPVDLKFFKQMTMGHPMIMGRKSYESLPGKLPDRPHIVITHQKDYHVVDSDIYIVHSLEEAIEKAFTFDTKIFITGGTKIYQEAFDKDLVDELFLTLILDNFAGNVFFPEIPENMILTNSSPSSKDDKNKHNLIFLHYFKE